MDEPRGRIALLAFTAGAAMASTYALQPLLPELARAFPDSAWLPSLAASAGPAGYVLGLMVLVPLGDSLPPRTLLVAQTAVLAMATALAAVSPSEFVLVASLLIAGMAATAAAQGVALSGRLAPERQGAAVGLVGMGLSIGILGGRVLAGVIGSQFGWRAPLGVLALTIAAAGLALRLTIPNLPAAGDGPTWRGMVFNVSRTLAGSAELRRATLVGGCWFAAFSSFWTVLAFQLAAAPLHKGPAFAGAFGVLGVVGAVVARSAGRASDRWGSRAVVFSGLAAALAGFFLLGLFPTSIAALALGALVMDAGCFAAQAATQVYVLRTGGDEPSRRYSAYMTAYWCSGAFGAFAAPELFRAIGWFGLDLFNAALIGVALCLHGRSGHMTAAAVRS